MKLIAQNKRAGFDYFLKEFIEAGLVLQGTEVKSLRAGKVVFNDSFVGFDRAGEAWLYNMSIGHYEFGNRANHEENRRRKLLLKKSEINDLAHRLKAEGLTLIPTKIYFKDSCVKIELALAKGKKLYDKRQSEAKKDAEKKLRKKEY